MSVSIILEQKGRNVLTAKPGDRLGDIASVLAERKVGAVVITDADAKILGILSERDIVRVIGTKGATALDLSAQDVMTKSVKLCSESDSITKVMQKMTLGRFRHLPVEKDGKLAGIISIGDVVKKRIEDIEREAEEIRTYIASA